MESMFNTAVTLAWVVHSLPSLRVLYWQHEHPGELQEEEDKEEDVYSARLGMPVADGTPYITRKRHSARRWAVWSLVWGTLLYAFFMSWIYCYYAERTFLLQTRDDALRAPPPSEHCSEDPADHALHAPPLTMSSILEAMMGVPSLDEQCRLWKEARRMSIYPNPFEVAGTMLGDFFEGIARHLGRALHAFSFPFSYGMQMFGWVVAVGGLVLGVCYLAPRRGFHHHPSPPPYVVFTPPYESYTPSHPPPPQPFKIKQLPPAMRPPPPAPAILSPPPSHHDAWRTLLHLKPKKGEINREAV